MDSKLTKLRLILELMNVKENRLKHIDGLIPSGVSKKEKGGVY